MSGINAKLVLAAMALSSFVLTGCEKEEFKVDGPSITIPDVDIPEAADGVAYVNLSATSNNGNALYGVEFTDESGKKLESSIEFKATTATTTLKIFASKDGYETVVKVVNVPALQKGAYVVIPVNFVLNAIEEDTKIEEGETTPAPAVDPVNEKIEGNYEPGKLYWAEVSVPVGAYLTTEQKEALLAAIDKLEGPTTRAELTDEDIANLLTAKGLLRDKVNKMFTEPQKEKQKISFKVTEAAKSVSFNVTTAWLLQKITITVEVAKKSYSVDGEQTKAGVSSIEAEAEGIVIEHGHGHGHGDGNNPGGGEGGK